MPRDTPAADAEVLDSGVLARGKSMELDYVLHDGVKANQGTPRSHASRDLWY
jgi:hypothetical protein